MRTAGQTRLGAASLILMLLILTRSHRAAVARAQAPDARTYIGGLQLVNLSDQANLCQLHVVDSAGAPAVPPVAVTLPALHSETFFPLTVDAQEPNAFVVECAMDTTTIANLMTQDFRTGAFYAAPSLGATTIYLPLLMHEAQRVHVMVHGATTTSSPGSMCNIWADPQQMSHANSAIAHTSYAHGFSRVRR